MVTLWAMALAFCIGVCWIGSRTVHGLARRQGQLVGVPLHRRHVTLCIRYFAWCVVLGRLGWVVSGWWCVVCRWGMGTVCSG